MKKGTVLAFCLLFVPAVGLLAQKRGMSNPNAVFVEKGTRSIGISAGWNSWNAQGEDGVDLLGIISGVKGSVNLFDVTAGGAWFVKDNLSVGLRVGFSDARADIDSTRFLGNDERDRHLIREALKGSVTCRQYLPLFDGRIIALFVEGRLTGQTGFYKNYNMTAQGKEGSYTGTGGVSLGFYPGVSVFATDRISFELSLPLLEGGYAWNDESFTSSADATLDHGYVRFKPSLIGLDMGLIFHF